MVDTSYNLNELEFSIKPVQNFSSIDNSMLLMSFIAIILIAGIIKHESVRYNKYICKLK